MRRKALFALAACLFAPSAFAQESDAGAPVDPPVEAPPSAAPDAVTTQETPVATEAAFDPALAGAAGEVAASDTLSAEELQALGLNVEAPAVDTDLHVSGFADFTVSVPIKPDPVAAAFNTAVGSASSFFIGNLNLFITKNLSEKLRTMMEVRFTYLPNGNLDVVKVQTGQISYADTTVGDYADGGHLERWGGIIMQRAYLEWNLHPRISVRAGQFLTPYGIWNVDHGSPAFIPVNRPFAIGNNWFPQRQTGFELFGRTDLGTNTALGYHLTLSNGTGPISEYRDLDKNKAVGARLFLEWRGAGYLRVGASSYYGRNTASVPTIAIGADGSLNAGTNVTNQSDVLALAADIQYKYKRFLAQSEWVTRQREYTRHRPPVVSLAGQGRAPDTLAYAGYVLPGYELPWWAAMPYFMIQYDKEVYEVGSANAEFLVAHGGVNMHPIDQVTFKIEYLSSVQLQDSITGERTQTLAFQAAWAF